MLQVGPSPIHGTDNGDMEAVANEAGRRKNTWAAGIDIVVLVFGFKVTTVEVLARDVDGTMQRH